MCEIVASPLQRRQLDTMDEDKIDTFEKNPCTMLGACTFPGQKPKQH